MSSHPMRCLQGCIAGSAHDWIAEHDRSGVCSIQLQRKTYRVKVIRSVVGGACESAIFELLFGREGRNVNLTDEKEKVQREATEIQGEAEDALYILFKFFSCKCSLQHYGALGWPSTLPRSCGDDIMHSAPPPCSSSHAGLFADVALRPTFAPAAEGQPTNHP